MANRAWPRKERSDKGKPRKPRRPVVITGETLGEPIESDFLDGPELSDTGMRKEVTACEGTASSAIAGEGKPSDEERAIEGSGAGENVPRDRDPVPRAGPARVDERPLILRLGAGLHRDVPAAEYHRKILGVASKGALDRVARSPAHYKAWIDGLARDDESAALAFGSAFHTAALEPERFAAEYCVRPDFGDCRKTENKSRRDAWLAGHEKHVKLSEEDAAAIAGMVASVHRHPLAPKLLLGEHEVTLRWRDAETGLECRARPDVYNRDLALAVDLKSAEDARPHAFAKSVANYAYHAIEAFYRGGFEALDLPLRRWLFLAVEKKPPFAIGIFPLDVEALSRGRDRVRAALVRLASCLESDVWPSYPEGIQEPLSLPPWA